MQIHIDTITNIACVKLVDIIDVTHVYITSIFFLVENAQ